MPSIVATTDPTTGTILLSMDQIEARDLFTRVVAGGWGTATTGEIWTTSGGAGADYSVNGTQGVISLTSVAVSRNTILSAVTVGADMDSKISYTIPVMPTGASISVGHGVRQTNTSNYYLAQLDIATTGVATLNLRSIVLGSFTTLTSVVLDQVHAAGGQWTVRIAACGSTIMAKAWRSTVTEPGWLISLQNFDLTTGTNVQGRAVLNTGNTNPLPVDIVADNLGTGVSQPIRIFRVTPDGTRTELRGSPLETELVDSSSTSGQAIAWDGEAPFDVNVFYEMTSNCSSTVVATSNTVNLSSGGTGWLRDPVDPTRNFQLVLDASYDDCLDQDIIVFSGLGNPAYTNASGIFDIIDAARPNTVSQTRKNYSSSLALTSFSLDDLIALEDIFAPGRILLLTLPTDYGWALRSSGTDYITCGDIVQSYIGADQRVTARGWIIPFRLSLAPADPGPGGVGGNGIGGGDATYDALAASAIGVDYNTLNAAALTYFQIASGTGY